MEIPIPEEVLKTITAYLPIRANELLNHESHDAVNLARAVASHPSEEEIWNYMLRKNPGYWIAQGGSAFSRGRHINVMSNGIGILRYPYLVSIHVRTTPSSHNVQVDIEDDVTLRKDDLAHTCIDYFSRAKIIARRARPGVDDVLFYNTLSQTMTETLEMEYGLHHNHVQELYAWLSINLIVLGVSQIRPEDVALDMADLTMDKLVDETRKLYHRLREELSNAILRM